MDVISVRLQAIAITLVWCVASSASGQMIQTNTPFSTYSNGFFEDFGFGFGFRIRGAFPPTGNSLIGILPPSPFAPNGNVIFRGPDLSAPPFGGNNFGANLGFGVLGKNVDLFFNLSAQQASSRQLATRTATLAVPHGGNGQLIDATFRPFVVGIVPVVGAQPFHPISPVTVSPVARALQRMSYAGAVPTLGISEGRIGLAPEGGGEPNARVESAAWPSRFSTAERGDISIAEIRRQKAAEVQQRQQTAMNLAERARAAQRKGKIGAARVLYRMAIKDANGQLESELRRELDALEIKRE